MDCLNELIGMKGVCEDTTGTSGLMLTKITRQELNDIIDQNDFASVDEMFSEKREEAVKLFLSEFQNEMQGKYIARTVISQAQVGNYSTLVASAASAVLKGVSFERCNTLPNLGYRITNVGFIGSYTGNVTVLYYDGITGVQLATDTIEAIAGQEVKLDVNRLFNVKKLMVVYDATAIGGYVTKVSYTSQCARCPNRYNVNKHTNARAVSATIGTPLTKSYTSDMGGLTVEVSMECDNTSWLCGIKQHLAMPIMFKLAEILMEYGLTSSSRGNTKTLRDSDSLKERHGYYKNEYEKHLKSTLERVILPNDPTCFHCKRQSGIYNAIP